MESRGPFTNIVEISEKTKTILSTNKIVSPVGFGPDQWFIGVEDGARVVQANTDLHADLDDLANEMFPGKDVYCFFTKDNLDPFNEERQEVGRQLASKFKFMETV